MNKKIKNNFFSLILSFVLLFGGLSNLAHAQETSGTLSFSPATLSFAPGETKSISVIWTGPGIEAAKVVVSVGTELSIQEFKNPGEGISFLINSPEAGEVHLGKLTEGPIPTGTTLFTMDLKANSCSQGGNIVFSSDSLVPEITLSFQNATYTCGAGGGTVPGVTNLPKTAIISDEYDKYLFASMLVSIGLVALYISRTTRNTNQYDCINLVTS